MSTDINTTGKQAEGAPSLVPTRVQVEVDKSDVSQTTTASANRGVDTAAVIEKLEPERSGYRSLLVDVTTSLCQRYNQPFSSGLVEELVLADRVDRTLIQATRNHVLQTRYPDEGSFGICHQGIRYNPAAVPAAGPVPTTVDVVAMYDMDNRWRTGISSQVASLKVSVNEELTSIMLEREKRVEFVMPMARNRGRFLEGQVALTLAKNITSSQTEDSYSPLSVAVKLEGYLLSLTTPADDGLIKTASIPADTPPVVGGDFFPTCQHPHPPAGNMNVGACFTSLKGLSDWLEGTTVLANCSPADIGRSIALVPVPKSQVHQADVLTWAAIAHFAYPFFDIVKTGDLSDLNGQLTHQGGAAPGANAQATWYPMSTLMHIDGIAPSAAPAAFAANAPNIRVIFVLVEDYPADNANLPPLALRGGVNVPYHAAIPQGTVALQPTFVALTQPAYLQGDAATHISDASALVSKYYGAYACQRDSTAFWASHTCVKQLSGEVSDHQNKGGVYAPEGAAQRGWVDAADLTPMITAAGVSHAARVWGSPTNSVGMTPAVTFDPGTGIAANAPNKNNFLLPPFDQKKAVGVAAGILTLSADPGPDGPDGISPSEAAPTNMRHARRVAKSFDIITSQNDFPRAIQWAVVPGIQLRPKVSERQTRAWGKRGTPRRDKDVSISALVSKWIFEGRVIAEYPSNGVVLNAAPATMPGCYVGQGPQMARFDLPSIQEEFPEYGKLSDSNSISPSQFKPDTFVIRNVGLAPRKDPSILVPDPRTPGDRDTVNNLAVMLDGMRADGNAGHDQYGQYRLTDDVQRAAGVHLPLNLFGPLTWGGLIGVPAWADALTFTPSIWSLTSGRPLSAYDMIIGARKRLVFRSAASQHASDLFVQYKPAYNVASYREKYSICFEEGPDRYGQALF